MTKTVGVALLALLLTPRPTPASADHLDSARAAAAPAADIADLYAWMASDGSRLNLLLTAFDGAGVDARLSTEVQYVFHVDSATSYGGRSLTTTVLCQFYRVDRIECWVDGGAAYAEGDPGVVGGVRGTDDRVRVFAARVNDPFFFDEDAFATTVDALADASAEAPRDDAGCPDLGEAVADGFAGGVNTFAGSAVLALVVQLDPALVTPGGPVVGVWATTRERSQ